MRASCSVVKLLSCVGLAVFALSLSLECAAEEATVDEAREEAMRHHFRGREHFQSGRYADAALEFATAQRLAPAPSNLFNLARCYLRLGRIDDALEAVETFLEQDIPDERRREGEAMQIALRDMAEGHAVNAGGDEPFTAPAVQPEAVDAQSADSEASGVPDSVPVEEPTTSSEADVSTTIWTGSLSVSVGASLPLPEENIGKSVGLSGELAGGLLLGRNRALPRYESRLIRIELFFETHIQPHTSGFLIELNGGPRLGIGLGGLPLWVEASVGLGAVGLHVTEGSGRQIPDGSYWGLIVIPTVSLVWQPLRWFEVVLRPIRVELVGIGGDIPGGFALRWSLDGGVRFRL